ncbi:hypothetical protein HHK36_015343 [Tetracentron sinense]|uniref:ZF-HD dimerization-type domain-containing protein n=1 Tax=Tetracentron sinense TaxID=13715 RepID=A0A834Z4X9_TETSI|nr:hypothetical protein HHK36_015343 [Tetracentron sinense]
MNITATSTATIKTLEIETETETPPPKTQPPKPLSFTNGALKRHHHHPPIVISYKECLKNHAATLGGHALDGCGEFMASPSATPTDPTSLKCAACGCHRNFHRREPDEGTHIVEYHHQQATPAPRRNSASPPPLSSSYYPSAPHMLLALSAAVSGPPDQQQGTGTAANGRKRFRTKFSKEQKEKMQSFSERLGWKMQKRDEGLVEEFCDEVGVGKGVFKVWMHNNKLSFGKKDGNTSSLEINTHNHPNDSTAHAVTNGSSASS